MSRMVRIAPSRSHLRLDASTRARRHSGRLSRFNRAEKRDVFHERERRESRPALLEDLRDGRTWPDLPSRSGQSRTLVHEELDDAKQGPVAGEADVEATPDASAARERRTDHAGRRLAAGACRRGGKAARRRSRRARLRSSARHARAGSRGPYRRRGGPLAALPSWLPPSTTMTSAPRVLSGCRLRGHLSQSRAFVQHGDDDGQPQVVSRPWSVGLSALRHFLTSFSAQS